MTILLAPTLDLALALPTPDLTVEAEYGSTVVEGSRYTAAHHQPAGSPYTGSHVQPDGRRAPCCDRDIPFCSEARTCLVSHLDLDTIGGCLRAMRVELFGPEHAHFWRFAEYVDTHGPHRAEAFARDNHMRPELRRLRAWWAWSRAHLPRVPRDVVTDVSERVTEAGRALARILADDADMIAAGTAFSAAEADLAARTLVRVAGPVLVRRSAGEFVSALYSVAGGACAAGIAALDTVTGAVTLSLAAPVPGVSCREIVQGLWGPAAGGHDGIAGSPRGQTMTDADLDAATDALRAALDMALLAPFRAAATSSAVLLTGTVGWEEVEDCQGGKAPRGTPWVYRWFDSSRGHPLMPVEVVLLKHRPELLGVCPRCGAQPFQSFLRGHVQRTALQAPLAWLWWWVTEPPWSTFPYCAVICATCKEIVGHEAPLRWP